MAKKSTEEARKQAVEQAAMWLEKMERTLRPDEGEALRDWLKVRMHREVIAARCRLWHGPEILGVLSTLFPVQTVEEAARPSWWARYGVNAVALAISVLGVGAIVLFAMSHKQAVIRYTETYQTPVGAARTFKLPDGSDMILNTASRVTISYGPTWRDAIVVRGEATFTLAEDARVFHVYAAKRRFDVESGVGSHFNVRRLTLEDVELMVMQGTVRARADRRPPARTPEQLRLDISDGEHAFVSPEAGRVGMGWYSSSALEPAEVTQKLAWQNGRIILTDRTLDEAIAEVARYTSAQFMVANDDLRSTRISADLKTGDVDGFLRILHDAFQIDARSDGEQRYVLSRASRPLTASPAGGISL